MTDTNPEAESKPKPSAPGESLSDQKLRLEIINLGKKNKRQFMPAITALISVSGLLVSVLLFGSQQAAEQEKNRTARELERSTALQNQMRSDTDEVLRFTGDPKLSVSRVAFLLSDIQTVLDSPVNEKQLAVAFPKYKETLTRSLAVLVKDDCDFSAHPRDVELANAVATYWSEYSVYLSKESKTFAKLDYILYKYERALQTLEGQNSGYLKSIHLDKDGLEPGPKYARRKDEHAVYSYFLYIADGFKKHLAILKDIGKDGEQLKQTHLEEFEGYLCNRAVSQYLLGRDFIEAPCKNGQYLKEKSHGNQKKGNR